MKSRLSDINIFLSALSILFFGYIKFLFEPRFIGSRENRFEQDSSPFLLCSGIIFFAIFSHQQYEAAQNLIVLK